MQCHATLWQTLAYSGIPWHNQCIISNCWRSVPLPCGQYMAIFKSTKVGPCEDDLECLGGPSSLCFLDKENRVGMYLGSQVTQPCNFCGFSSNWILHYFPTVRPSVHPCVTGVTSHISHIYKGINAMLIIRGPIKPYKFWIKIILAIFLETTRPDKTIFSALTNLTIDFDFKLSKV